MEWRTCVLLLCVTAVLADDEWREVRTAQGPVRGHKHPTEDLYTFFNIPYATAPVGVDKFKVCGEIPRNIGTDARISTYRNLWNFLIKQEPPVLPPLPPPVWLEPYDAIDKEVRCPQHPIPDWSGSIPKTSENCLIANVYVPNTKETNLSVVVYFHWGGFVMGYGDQLKATQFMKTKDMITVTFNYRLGVHGFLCLGTEDIPGNAGMKDQVALLRWVQKNIASFGGNPDDVTIIGCSAGSASVDLLMLSKSAEGLFHKVVPESGGNLAAFTVQRDPLEIAKTFARQLNFTNVDDIYALEDFYKTAPLELLTSDSFMYRTDSTFLFSPCVEPVIDGAFLTESPLSILKKGTFTKYPLLYGFANMEGLMRVMFYDLWKPKMNDKFSDFLPADLKFESEEEREDVANKIKKFYFGEKPIDEDNILGYVDFFSDILINYPMLRSVKFYVEAGNDQVYLYVYSFVEDDDYVVPHTNIRGASHCAQTVAVMDGKNVTHHDEALASPRFKELKKVVREIWHNFVKTGKPVPEGSLLPTWPAAGADRSPHMVLDDNLELRGVLLEERTRFWDDIYQRYYRDAVPPPKPPPKAHVEL